MHCCIVCPGTLRVSLLVLISHNPGLRDGSSAENADVIPMTLAMQMAPTARMIFPRDSAPVTKATGGNR
jgi:hypothetical protein